MTEGSADGEPPAGYRLMPREMAPDERPQIGSLEGIVNLPGLEMAALEQDHLRVVLLDSKHRIKINRTVYQGGVNQKR